MDAAKADGATIAVGGSARADLGAGNYVAPTLFTGANNQMKIAREEIFGPVLTAISFDTEEQAVQIERHSLRFKRFISGRMILVVRFVWRSNWTLVWYG